MAIDPILLASASTQAELIASGQMDVHDLMARQVAAIKDLNPALNAFVEIIQPRDPREIATSRSPLWGTSFGVKDNIDVQGVTSRSGLKAYMAQPGAPSASAVFRLTEAGLFCVGKLNMHPMALGTTNHNPDFGDCFNPRRAHHTPGGSSGGSGAAVAAGMCAIALGTDTMGSVRIPAAYCGVVGFKPSFGAIPMDGVVPLCRALDHVGLLARSIEDVTHAFRIVGNSACPISESALHSESSRSGRAWRFAIPRDPQRLQLSPQMRAAYERALMALERRGFSFHPIDLDDYPFARLRRAGLLLSEAELVNTLAEPLRRNPEAIPSDLRAMLQFASNKSAPDLARSLSEVVQAGHWLNQELLPVDALILPTTGQAAFPMDSEAPIDQADFTAMANMSGGPALSLPLPVLAGDLPLGLQLIASRGCDWTLLWAAQAVADAIHQP